MSDVLDDLPKEKEAEKEAIILKRERKILFRYTIGLTLLMGIGWNGVLFFFDDLVKVDGERYFWTYVCGYMYGMFYIFISTFIKTNRLSLLEDYRWGSVLKEHSLMAYFYFFLQSIFPVAIGLIVSVLIQKFISIYTEEVSWWIITWLLIYTIIEYTYFYRVLSEDVVDEELEENALQVITMYIFPLFFSFRYL